MILFYSSLQPILAQSNSVTDSLLQELQKMEIDSNKMNVLKELFNYQLEKKELQNRLLQHEKKINEAELETFKARRIVGITLFVSTMAAFLFYFRSYKQQKRNNRLLTLQKQAIEMQNKEIASQNEEIIVQHDQLSIQSENLAKANQALNQLFTIISHDLRGPLNTIKGFVNLIKNEFIKPEEMKDFSNKLLDSVTHTSGLLENLLYWSKTQLHGIKANRRIFDIGEIIVESIDVLEPQARLKNIHVKKELSAPLSVYADRDMIYTVIRNLISNAVKFCDSNDTIIIFSQRSENHVTVTVKDSGSGMSHDILNNIFDPSSFYSSTGTQNEKGTGLGLKLCQELIKMNEGSIWAESEIDKGSVFSFTVPKAKFL